MGRRCVFRWAWYSRGESNHIPHPPFGQRGIYTLLNALRISPTRMMTADTAANSWLMASIRSDSATSIPWYLNVVIANGTKASKAPLRVSARSPVPVDDAHHLLLIEFLLNEIFKILRRG